MNKRSGASSSFAHKRLKETSKNTLSDGSLSSAALQPSVPLAVGPFQERTTSGNTEKST